MVLETYDGHKDEEEQNRKKFLTKENVDGIVCKMCGILKPYDSFSKSTPKYCKKCISEKNKRYHELHKDEINKRKKIYMQDVFKTTHPNYKKDYYNEHRFDISNERKSNKEKYKSINHDYYIRNCDRIKADTTERGKKYRNIQLRTRRFINKIGIRPDVCPICGYESDIVAHHPDYSKRYEIVFCCKSCHRFIHDGIIDCPSVINVLDYKQYNG